MTSLTLSGIEDSKEIRTKSTANSQTAYRWNLGWFCRPSGGSNNTYVHVKTDIQNSHGVMVKFEVNGYGYSDKNVYGSLTVYTYAQQNTPFTPTYVNWGSSAWGISNCYYSAGTPYLVVVLKVTNSYQGGFLYAQSGGVGGAHPSGNDINVLAYTTSASTSGAY